MEKKYQVFVSSTFKDLEEERKSVIWQLQSMGYIAVGMEAFPSSNSNAWKVITRQIDMSDYYVLILKNTYGSMGDEGISYTEKEYDYAVSKGIPVLAFVYGGESTKNVNQDVNREAEKKLIAFKAKVDENHTRTTWRNTDELNSKVAAAIATEVNVDPREGWVRAGTVEENTALLNQINTLRIEKNEVESENHRQAVLLKENGVANNGIVFAKDDELFEFQANEQTFSLDWNTVFGWIGKDLLTGLTEETLIYELEKGFAAKVLGKDGVAHEEIEKVEFAPNPSEQAMLQFVALGWIEIETTSTILPLNQTVDSRLTRIMGLARTTQRLSSIYRLSNEGRGKYFAMTAILGRGFLNLNCNSMPR